MAANNLVDTQLDSHTRTIFIQNLSPETTKQSLDAYFSDYPIDWSAVPLDDKGKNKMHGIVTFKDRASVDAVMLQRLHRIDGKEVLIHRSIPSKQSAKENCGIQQLIVSGSTEQPLTESDIQGYFSRYGDICNITKMNNNDNTWIIDFDYYDSVDQILQTPYSHYIGKTNVSVKKGDRNVPRKRSLTPGPSLREYNKNDSPGILAKRSNPKQVTMNEQVSYLRLPQKRYRIHITNLPIDTDAEKLSDKFEWDICDIVMDPSVGDRSSSLQCWLKNANNEKEVDDFIRRWNNRVLSDTNRTTIQCEKEEDDLELCKNNRVGRCSQSAKDCHWEHIKCTAENNCASACPYGHELDVKAESNSRNSVLTSTNDYRIKMTGFQSEVTPSNLTQRFGSHNYYVDPKHNRVGYIVKVKTMKYAKELMNKWHNHVIDGQKIKCQLEVNPISPVRRNRSQSRAASTDGELTRQRSRSRPQDTRSEGAFNLEDANNIMSTTFNNKELDRDRRISGKTLNQVIQMSSKANVHRVSSSENIASSINSKYELPKDFSSQKWEITTKATYSDGKVFLIRSKDDRRYLAMLKMYPEQLATDFDRELNIMKHLKDVKCISQLIEPENDSNNFVRGRHNGDNLWMIIKRAPGHSLKEFIERKFQSVLEISVAIQLILKVVKILQEIHRKGIFHQNLSPKNIMIEWDPKDPIDQAQLTVLNFSRALMVSNIAHTPVTSSTKKWYHTRQSDIKGLSSTVDPSDICAIFFWLVTRIHPQHENDKLPHQQARDELSNMIKNTIKSLNMSPPVYLEEQLKMYLIDTFDRAFGYPSHHPWTINDLQCRLESIHQLLIPIDDKLSTMDSIFKELTSISSVLPAQPIVINEGQHDAFEVASKAFYEAKKCLSESDPERYEWSNGYCAWTYNFNSSISEGYNNDILIYYPPRRSSTPYRIIITCWAICSEEGRVMTLSIGSSVYGKTIQMPIGQYSTAQDYTIKAQKSFNRELINLLLAVCKERKSKQLQ